MKIVVPYVTGGLRDETRQAVRGAPLEHEPRFVQLDDTEAYWRLWHELWEAAETVTVVEQDIVPTGDVFRSFDSCPEPWCAFGYPYHHFGEYAGTGCVRFRHELLKTTEGLIDRVGAMSDSKHPPRHWCRLDAWMQIQLRNAGYRIHVHQPAVEHLSTECSHGCVPN